MCHNPRDGSEVFLWRDAGKLEEVDVDQVVDEVKRWSEEEKFRKQEKGERVMMCVRVDTVGVGKNPLKVGEKVIIEQSRKCTGVPRS